ncbi:MAG: hypothetical protein O9286_13470 [Aquidulcibacter sp.]|uniref:hypothetical protein n=1 Tax=Aquidulcibacter sp. TaxID=2052990 RepID=UPI0022BC9950|nr:hypothetical protein [Aquidulcibacter sp.]
MKMKIYLLALLISGIFQVGHASAQRLQAIESPGVTIRFQNGEAMALSVKNKSALAIVARGGAFDGKGPEAFLLYVENRSELPINLLPSSISVLRQGKEKVNILTSEEVRRETRRAAYWAGFGNRLAAAAARSSSGGQGQTSSSTTSFGQFGSTPFSIQSYTSGTFTDPRAAAIDRAESNRASERAMEAVKQRENEVRESAEPMLFAAQTIDAGKWYVTPFAIPKLQRSLTSLEIRVEIGGEVHLFQFGIFP